MSTASNRVFWALLSAVLTALPAAAQDTEQERRPLRGMREIRVVVESLHPSGLAVGLVASQLQTSVEVQLRKHGVPVAASSAPGESGYLYLKVITRQVPEGGFPFNIDLQLRDLVYLVREPAVTTRATTWARYKGGYAKNIDELALQVHESIGALVEMFADEYVAANSSGR
jgi:hypothetical protein